MKNLTPYFFSLTLSICLFNCSTETQDKNLVRMDITASELNRTNEILEKAIGLEYINFYNAENYDSIKFGRVIQMLDQVYVKIIEQAGGFEPGFAELRLFDPSNTRSPEHYITQTNVLANLIEELTKVINEETNPVIKTELKYLKDKVFGDQLSSSTAAEFRLRYLIAKNRLYLLEQMTESSNG